MTKPALFVEVFCGPVFIVLFAGPMSLDDANDLVDNFLQVNKEAPFAKQPVIERCSGDTVGPSVDDHLLVLA